MADPPTGARAGAGFVPHCAPPPGYAGPRRALVLPGGGARAAYQAGALRALWQHGVSFAHVDASSTGSLNLAMLFSGLSPREMCARWSSLSARDLAPLLVLEEHLHTHQGMGLHGPEGVRDRLFPRLGVDIRRINAAGGMEGTVSLGDFNRKTVEAVPHDRLEVDLLLAGVSLPLFLPPVRRVNSWYTDPSWIRAANLLEAVRRGAEELWVVWTVANTSTWRPGALRQLGHMLEMAANGSLADQLERIAEINRRIEAGESVHGRTRPIRLHLVRPEDGLPLDPDLHLGNVGPAFLVGRGYADAAAYLRTLRPEGLPLIPEVTQMSERVPAVTFTETMSGAFALGETEPKAGAKAGKQAGHELAMHATVVVRDLDRFVQDPQHGGIIIGRIDFTPFGTDIPCEEGVFRLFSPAEDPRTKLMVYELPFVHEGERYYLAGRKEVRDDPGFDAWSDMTTLFTRLHKGADAGAPVVGAGVLSLSAAEFARVLRSMKVLDADDPADSVRQLATFGRFFAGNVWESYAPLAPTPPRS